MIKRILSIITVFIIGLVLVETILPMDAARAENDVCNLNANDDAKTAAGCVVAKDDPHKDTATIAQTILKVMYWVIFSLAVIMIIVGGLMYVLSAGDPGKIQRAKNTILVSVIGLIIATLASAIINFVISSLVKGG